MNEASVEGAKNSAVERNNLEILYKTSTDQTKSLQERKDAQVKLQETYPLTFQNYTDEEFALGKAKIGFDNLTDSVLALATMKAKQSVLDKMAMEKEEFMVTKTAELTQAISDQTNARTTWGKVAGYTREENIREEIAAKKIEFDLNSKAIIGEIEGAKTKSKLAEEEKVASGIAAKTKTDDEAKAKAKAEKNAADYKARKEQEAKINEDFRVSQLSAEQKSFDDFYNAQKVFLDNKNITKKEFDQRLVDRQAEIDNVLLEAGKKLAAEEVKIQNEKNLLIAEGNKKDRKEKFDNLLSDQEKIITDSATTLEQKLEALDIENNAIIDSTDMLLEDKIIKLEENEKRQLEITKKSNQDKLNSGLDLAKQGLASIQAVTDVAFEAKLKKVKKGSKEEEKLMRQQFALNKKMQLAGAIVDGAKAVIASLASAPIAIGVVPNPVGIASLAFTVAASLANVAKIASTQFEGGGAGGETTAPDLSGGGNMDAINTSPNGIQPSTQLDENGNVISNQNNNQQPIQAYMVESQATSVQNNVAMIESSMTFHAPALNPL
jgi:hypothetical protein